MPCTFGTQLNVFSRESSAVRSYPLGIPEIFHPSAGKFHFPEWLHRFIQFTQILYILFVSCQLNPYHFRSERCILASYIRKSHISCVFLSHKLMNPLITGDRHNPGDLCILIPQIAHMKFCTFEDPLHILHMYQLNYHRYQTQYRCTNPLPGSPGIDHGKQDRCGHRHNTDIIYG